VQAGRGGKHPELRTLFFRLLKFLALPVHPLFVYDGKHKPPFKRGKATANSYGSAPIIGLSKILVDLFKFPRHDAPGEAEAECARLQRAGIVDAVMSNDVDALMFGSKLTVMNFSKESGSKGSAATHVTCYEMDNLNSSSCSRLDRAGMILFAMLSGGDYLPSGVTKCGSKLAGEIARAGFGADLLEVFESEGTELEVKLSEWRERLQYELEENESGYFQTKHKAVRIPETFPDRTIFSYYAKPMVSTSRELEVLQARLANAWDQEIDALELRKFTADTFEWSYRSGARKVIRLLAEPLICYRLRLRKELMAFPFRLSENDAPMLQKVYKSRTSFSNDGLTELQLDYVPVDIVGLDLLAEEPNPPLPPQETAGLGDEEEDMEVNEEPAPQSPAKKRVTKRFDPYASEKLWVFETLATIGIPEVVQNWKQEESEKASARKNTRSRKTGPKKKGPIDPGMKRGSILKYGTLTKERSDISQFKQAQLFESAISPISTPKKHNPSSSQDSLGLLNISRASSSHDLYYRQQMPTFNRGQDFDNLADKFSLCKLSPKRGVKRHPMASRSPLRSTRGAVLLGDLGVEILNVSEAEPLDYPSSPVSPGGIRMSYTSASNKIPAVVDSTEHVAPVHVSRRNLPKHDQGLSKTQSSQGAQKLEQAKSTSLLDDSRVHESIKSRLRSSKSVTPTAKRQPREPDVQISKCDSVFPEAQTDCTSSKLGKPSPPTVQGPLEKVALDKRTAQREKSKKTHVSSAPKPCKESLDLGRSSPPSALGPLETVAPETLVAPKKTSEKTHAPLTPIPPKKDDLKSTKPSMKPDNPSDGKSDTQKSTSHAGSIIVYDGYWTIEKIPIAEPVSGEPKSEVDNKDTGRSFKQTRKKRLPRVSILDLSSSSPH
jgi:Holliday junction resolvase YEN1